MTAAGAIAAALGRALGEAGITAGSIGSFDPACGDRTFSVDTGHGRVFVKLSAAPARLAAEADGLAALAAGKTLRLPQVFGLEAVDAQCSLLALEWLELRDGGDEAALGQAIAELHAIGGKCYGWGRDNFIGATPQLNGWYADWATFLIERRLRPQLRWAAERGAADLAALAEPVLQSLEQRFAAAALRPALLHGDLWRGNVGFVAGRPAVFDPAVHFGDGEADIAMSELFGGFGPRFYRAYRQLHPEPPDGHWRRQLYALYHLLNHFNLFGGGYAAQARQLIGELRSEAHAR